MNVLIIDDNLLEGSEEFNLTISHNIMDQEIIVDNPSTITVTIVDDEGESDYCRLTI